MFSGGLFLFCFIFRHPFFVFTFLFFSFVPGAYIAMVSASLYSHLSLVYCQVPRCHFLVSKSVMTTLVSVCLPPRYLSLDNVLELELAIVWFKIKIILTVKLGGLGKCQVHFSNSWPLKRLTGKPGSNTMTGTRLQLRCWRPFDKRICPCCPKGGCLNDP